METHITAKDPSELQRALSDVPLDVDNEIHLTLGIYAPLEGKYTPHGHSHDDGFGKRLLEPLYDDWVKSIRDIQIPPAVFQSSEVKVTLDLTRPETYVMNLMHYECRGTMRISAILRKIFRGVAELRACVVGMPCWCLLRESEKHIVLPKEDSWPVDRASHYHLSGRKLDKVARESLCVRLAEEHWDDEHWSKSLC